MTHDTLAWWVFLCTVSVVNVAAWTASAAVVSRRLPNLGPDVRATVWLQLVLSAGYVAGCAWRSVFPVYDVQRQVLVDGWWSSVIVGRSVATVAELCFAAQWALLLHRASRMAGSDFGHRLSHVVVPMIVVAEVFSWHAVLTTANLGHVIEESIWGATAALMVLATVALWPRCGRPHRPYLALWILVGLAYVAYMFGVDVPMYWARWVNDEAQGRHYLSVAQGLLDASGRWTVSHRWQDWESEVVWMSLYFSVAVWLSIGLIHVAARVRTIAPEPCRSGWQSPAG